MSKQEKRRAGGFSDVQLKEVKAAFLQLNPAVGDKEQVLKAAKALREAGLTPGAICKVAKEDYKVGISIRMLGKAREKAAPKSVEKRVEAEVTKEVVAEATEKIKAVLATGKDLEDQLGRLASYYGFDSTADFVIAMYDFWDTWKDHVGKVVQENSEYRWAIQELVKAFTPEAKKRLRDQAVKDLVVSTVIMGQQTGKFPPPETMRGYIQVLREELKD